MYPFEEWKTYYPGMEQYTAANCDRAAEIFDQLLMDLASDGPEAKEELKLKHFHKAIVALNKLNYQTFIIETWEREQLAELVNEITRLSGLDPANYAEGAGVADLWRAW